VIRDIVVEAEGLVDEGEVVVVPEEEGEDAEGISSHTVGQTLAVVRLLSNSKLKRVNQAVLLRRNPLKTQSRSRLRLETQMHPQIEERYWVSIRIQSILTMDHRRTY
jgi:hypothetical protein